MIEIKKDWEVNRVQIIDQSCSVEQVLQKLITDPHEIVVLSNGQGTYSGYVTKSEMLLSLANKENKLQPGTRFRCVTEGNEYNLEELEENDYLLIMTEDHQLKGILSREDLQNRVMKDRLIFLENAVEYTKMGILAIDCQGRITVLNKRGREIAEIEGGLEAVYHKPFLDLYEDPSILEVLENEQEQLNRSFHFDDVKLLINRSPVYHNGILIGVVSVYEDKKRLEEMSEQLEFVQNLNRDLKAIVDSIYDEIIVIDREGTILRVSKKSFNFSVTNTSELVGQNLIELEEKGLFKPSVSRHVIQNKKKVSIIQENNIGKNILAVGNPILNESGELDRVVIALRDITELSELKRELHKAKTETEKYKNEIHFLKTNPKFKRDLIYKSDIMKNLLVQVEKIAKVDSTVFIYGESGTGKEVIAENIHHLSDRSDHPFIKVNCGAIPENLLESELFGYEKGAFTGALSKGKKGFFELANKGTLFLDEIGELPLNLQVKLLQALQDFKIMRVGGSCQIPVDLRIIAATNKKLEDLVEKNLFRKDLYYRLAVIPLQIPPLRERYDDIESITYHFLNSFNQKYKTEKHFSEDAFEVLKGYHWPGNVRELQNIVERAVVTCNETLITAEDLSPLIFYNKKNNSEVSVSEIMPLKKAIDLVEEQLLIKAIKKYKSTSQVARALEISQPTAWRKINKIKNEIIHQ